MMSTNSVESSESGSIRLDISDAGPSCAGSSEENVGADAEDRELS